MQDKSCRLRNISPSHPTRQRRCQCSHRRCECPARAHSHRNTASCAHGLLPLLPTFRLSFTFERFWGVVPSMHERRSVIIPRCALGFIAGLLEFPKPLTGIEFLPAKSGCSCRVVMVENHCKRRLKFPHLPTAGGGMLRFHAHILRA